MPPNPELRGSLGHLQSRNLGSKEREQSAAETETDGGMGEGHRGSQRVAEGCRGPPEGPRGPQRTAEDHRGPPEAAFFHAK